MSNFDINSLVGMEKKDAEDLIINNGFIIRIKNDNENSFMTTMDYREDRVNLSIKDNKIISVVIG